MWIGLPAQSELLGSSGQIQFVFDCVCAMQSLRLFYITTGHNFSKSIFVFVVIDFFSLASLMLDV